MTEPADETPGARIAAARRAAGLTQRQLAERLGVTKGRVSQLECDWRGAEPTVETARRLAAELGIEWTSIFSA